MTGLFIDTMTSGRWRQNCYTVQWDNGDAVIIDPGLEADRIFEHLEDSHLNPLAIFNTHAHYDHVGAVAALKKRFLVPFFLHSKELKTLEQANLYRKLLDGEAPVAIPVVDSYLDAIGSPISIADRAIEVLFTPGHTRGSVCFMIEGLLFTGDTLLEGKVGRVDLPGGDGSALRDSLRQLSLLPRETKVYPGHGETTTILNEIQGNPDFKKAIDGN